VFIGAGVFVRVRDLIGVLVPISGVVVVISWVLCSSIEVAQAERTVNTIINANEKYFIVILCTI